MNVEASRKTGFLVTLVGGTGARGGDGLIGMLERRGFRNEVIVTHVDADATEESDVKRRLSIALDVAKADTLIENAPKYGAWVPAMVENVRHLLTAADVKSGAATNRGFTAVALEFHRREFSKFYAGAVEDLLKRPGVSEVQPVIVGSAGGGTGSALMTLVPRMLARGEIMGDITLGVSKNAVAAPFIVAGMPIAYAKHTEVDTQRNNILANCYAWSRDMVELRRRGLIQAITVCNSTNRAGVVLSDKNSFNAAVRRMAMESILNYELFQRRTRDVATNRLTQNYSGLDTPEQRYGDVRRMMASFYPEDYAR